MTVAKELCVHATSSAPVGLQNTVVVILKGGDILPVHYLPYI